MGNVIRRNVCTKLGLGYSVVVPQSKVAIREEWGKFDVILQPGFHWVNPWKGQKIAGYLDLKIKQLSINCLTKTKDNVFVTIVLSVQYRVVEERAKDAFFKLSNPNNQIQAFVLNAVRSHVPKMDLDSVFEQKNEIADIVEDNLEKAMEGFGYRIEQTLVIDVEPDSHVRTAMNEINAAARNRAAATEKAEAEKILQVKRAEGEAIVQVKRAEAEAEAKYLAGVGVARQRQAIVDGLRESVLTFSSNVPAANSRDVMDMVLLTQYFDTMKDIGATSKTSTVFLPHGPGAVHDVAEQIRNGMLQANAA